MSWDACTQETIGILRWMECHPGVAGYVQAFGVIFSLAGVLLWQPCRRAYLRWKAKRARMHRTIVFAIGLEGYVGEIEASVREALLKFKTGARPPSFDPGDLVIRLPAQLDPNVSSCPSNVDEQRLRFIFDLADSVAVYNARLSFLLQSKYFEELGHQLQSLWQQSVAVLNRIEKLP